MTRVLPVRHKHRRTTQALQLHAVGRRLDNRGQNHVITNPTFKVRAKSQRTFRRYILATSSFCRPRSEASLPLPQPDSLHTWRDRTVLRSIFRHHSIDITAAFVCAHLLPHIIALPSPTLFLLIFSTSPLLCHRARLTSDGPKCTFSNKEILIELNRGELLWLQGS